MSDAAGRLIIVVSALYRRYRPDTFAEVIGQEHVTRPLMNALRANRVNHAYLFSGPRGCGKTTSARILARCLNCAEGPTDTPCGVCPSCVELSTGGSGSLDVVEIDAASHGGVDDARDLRERAVFAPARDRYKVFIIDEAHMVTAGGFNALLKIVEEPPEHVKFVFATTEPDKVIGTIRSRTHHYPFRLVPPSTMTAYLEKILAAEKITAEPGVLPLIVRAGGGSVRDTLSVADQLIAGSDGSTIAYAYTVTLLGYTPSELLTQVIDALAARDSAAVFASVERVIESGQDPRRFVEDLLERLRDLILVSNAGPAADAVLASVAPGEADVLVRQAAAFGAAQLVRAATLTNAALTAMVGATSPRIHLEVLAARLLLPESDDTALGTLSRLDRVELRLGVDSSGAAPQRPVERTAAAAPQAERDVPAAPLPVQPDDSTPTQRPSSSPSVPQPGATSDEPPAWEPPVWVTDSSPAETPSDGPVRQPESHSEGSEQGEASVQQDSSAPVAPPASRPTGEAMQAAPLSAAQMRDAWMKVLEILEQRSRLSWNILVTANVVGFTDDVLSLGFHNHGYVEKFRSGGEIVDTVRGVILEVTGVRVRFTAKVLTEQPDSAKKAAPENSEHAPKYGEAVIREMLKAVPVDEENKN